MNIRSEQWRGHTIRFVEKGRGEWWAILADIARALGLSAKGISRRLPDEVISNHHVLDSRGRKSEMLVVNEYGIYETIFESRKKEAKDFRLWVFDIIKTLRKASGLEEYQVMTMTEPSHARKCTDMLRDGMSNPSREVYVKASAIANKVVSSKFGYSKSIKKGDMTPEMLLLRDDVYEDTVYTMVFDDQRNLGMSISETIYRKYGVPLKKAQ